MLLYESSLVIQAECLWFIALFWKWLASGKNSFSSYGKLLHRLPQPLLTIPTLRKQKREFLTAFYTESETSRQEHLQVSLTSICCVYTWCPETACTGRAAWAGACSGSECPSLGVLGARLEKAVTAGSKLDITLLWMGTWTWWVVPCFIAA